MQRRCQIGRWPYLVTRQPSALQRLAVALPLQWGASHTEGVHPLARGPENGRPPRRIAGAGSCKLQRRASVARALGYYGFSTGRRTAFPHSVQEPS